MAVQISWLLENRVLLVEFEHYMLPPSLTEIDRQIERFVSASSENAVHVVIKDHAWTPVIRDFDEFAVFENPKIGWTVIYGVQNTLLRYIASAVSNMLGLRIRHVDSREEALKTLAELDTALAAPVLH